MIERLLIYTTNFLSTDSEPGDLDTRMNKTKYLPPESSATVKTNGSNIAGVRGQGECGVRCTCRSQDVRQPGSPW